MSFGFSVSDIAALTALAWTTVQRCRKAGSQHQELTDQVSSVHLVLQRFEREMLARNGTMRAIDHTYREEIGKILSSCQKPLRHMDKILERYNGLENGRKNVRDLYQRVRFSSGEVVNLQQLRTTLTHQTNELTLYLNIILVGALGRVERQLNESGKELREMKVAVNGIAASLIMKASHDGSVLTTYTQDDGGVWRKFRREMIGRGFKSSFLQKNESLIHAYLEELSDRGALDEPDLTNTASENAHPCNGEMEMANAQPGTLVNGAHPQVGSPGSRKGHRSLDSRGKSGEDVKVKVTKKTDPDHKASIGSRKSIPNHAPETSSSQPEKARRLQSIDRKNSPLSIWSILDPEQKWIDSLASDGDLSPWQARIFVQLIQYRRTHAVSLSPFFTEPPYSFYLNIKRRESLDCGNSLISARIPLQLAMNAPWAKPEFWLQSKGQTLQNWQRWQRAHEPAVKRTYRENSQGFDRFYLACPWGISMIYKGYNVSLIFADLEFVSRVVGHAKWQHLYCMGPEHRSIWASLVSKPYSVTQFLSSCAIWHVPVMEALVFGIADCLTSEEDVSPWAADHSAEGEGPPTIEDVHGLACLNFVAKALTVNFTPLDTSDTNYFQELVAVLADQLKRYTEGDTLARLVDLCIDVDRAHIWENHSIRRPCRIKE